MSLGSLGITGPVTTTQDDITIKVTAIGARTLLLRKNKEKPDVYAQVEYKGQTFETECLKNTCNPRWNQTFEFAIIDKDALGELFVSVWDAKNSVKKKNHVFLGEVKLLIGDFSSVNYEFTDSHRYELQKRNKGGGKTNVGGTLDLRVGMKIPESKTKRQKTRRSAARKPVDDLLGETRDAPRTTEEIVQEAEDVADDTLKSITRTVQMAQTTKQIGHEIIDNLGDQGERLVKTQQDLDDLDEIFDRNDKHLAVIESPFGGIKNKFKRKDRGKNVETADKLIEEQSKKMEAEKSKNAKIQAKIDKEKEKKMKKNGVGEVVDARPDISMLSTDAQAKVDQTDRALDILQDLVSDMKQNAIAIGDEIQQQNTRIEVLQQGIGRAEARGAKQTQRVKRAMGGKG